MPCAMLDAMHLVTAIVPQGLGVSVSLGPHKALHTYHVASEHAKQHGLNFDHRGHRLYCGFVLKCPSAWCTSITDHGLVMDCTNSNAKQLFRVSTEGPV